MNKRAGESEQHIPVLLAPVLEGLSVKPNGTYIDGTFGRGGHSREIIKRLGPEGRLIAVDRDPDAEAAVDDSLADDPRFEFVRGEIAQLDSIGAAKALVGKVDGLLLDLGVSSPQLDDPERGFSFRSDGPLDMRMDTEKGRGAWDWLASADEKELKRVLFEYGEEYDAPRIAKAIVAARATQPILRTAQLADIVAAAVPARHRKIHPATKTFQAIRIHMNEELQQLREALAASIQLLRKRGRLCVISFHSLEDRIVKRFLRHAALVSEPYRGLPDVPEAHRPTLEIVGNGVSATAAEVRANRRARSARLRIAERL